MARPPPARRRPSGPSRAGRGPGDASPTRSTPSTGRKNRGSTSTRCSQRSTPAARERGRHELPHGVLLARWRPRSPRGSSAAAIRTIASTWSGAQPQSRRASRLPSAQHVSAARVRWPRRSRVIFRVTNVVGPARRLVVVEHRGADVVPGLRGRPRPGAARRPWPRRRARRAPRACVSSCGETVVAPKTSALGPGRGTVRGPPPGTAATRSEGSRATAVPVRVGRPGGLGSTTAPPTTCPPGGAPRRARPRAEAGRTGSGFREVAGRGSRPRPPRSRGRERTRPWTSQPSATEPLGEVAASPGP